MKTLAFLPDYRITDDGRVFSLISKKFLSNKKHRNGYLYLSLRCNGSQKTFYIHRLVAMAYVDNPLLKKEVNHKNGLRNDNRRENLEWVTHSENHKHAFIHLNRRPGRLKLLPKDIECIRFFGGEKWCRDVLAKVFNVSPGTVSNVFYRTGAYS